MHDRAERRLVPLSSPTPTAWDIPRGIAKALGDFGGQEQLVVLPSLIRDDEEFYSRDDIHAFRLISNGEVRASFLYEDRKFLTEMSAGVVVSVALGIIGNISADTLVMMARYIRDRAGIIITKRLIRPDSDVEVDVKVARVTKTAAGAVTVEGLQVRGSALATSLAIVSMFADPAAGDDIIDNVVAVFAEGDDSDA